MILCATFRLTQAQSRRPSSCSSTSQNASKSTKSSQESKSGVRMLDANLKDVAQRDLFLEQTTFVEHDLVTESGSPFGGGHTVSILSGSGLKEITPRQVDWPAGAMDRKFGEQIVVWRKGAEPEALPWLPPKLAVSRVLSGFFFQGQSLNRLPPPPPYFPSIDFSDFCCELYRGTSVVLAGSEAMSSDSVPSPSPP